MGDNATIICSKLYGSAKIGQNSYITDATVANQMIVGDNTVIGMGSLITKPIPSNVIAYGLPAKVIRENDSEL